MPVTDKKLDKASRVIHALDQPRVIFGLLITTIIIQAVNNSINPIISLFIKELMHGGHGVTLVAGIVWHFDHGGGTTVRSVKR